MSDGDIMLNVEQLNYDLLLVTLYSISLLSGNLCVIVNVDILCTLRILSVVQLYLHFETEKTF